MTIILEDYCIAGAGTFEIRQPVHLTISAETARRAVTHWLVFEITMMLSGEEPTLVIGERTRWQVPVIFSASGPGRVGIVGTVEVDAASGEIDKDPANLEAMLCAARKLGEKLPPFQVKEVPPQYLAKHLPPAPRLELQADGELIVVPNHEALS